MRERKEKTLFAGHQKRDQIVFLLNSTNSLDLPATSHFAAARSPRMGFHCNLCFVICKKKERARENTNIEQCLLLAKSGSDGTHMKDSGEIKSEKSHISDSINCYLTAQ